MFYIRKHYTFMKNCGVKKKVRRLLQGEGGYIDLKRYSTWKTKKLLESVSEAERPTISFPNDFKKIIQDDGYHPKQVFNVTKQVCFGKNVQLDLHS